VRMAGGRCVRANWLWLPAVLALALTLTACASAQRSSAQADLEQATVARVLRVYNWDTYIDPDILTEFELQFAVEIDYQVFDSDVDLLEELRDGATDRYDVVVPSDFTVAIMRTEGLLAPLDKANIPNFENVDPTFLSPVFDPANRYCAPYQWGTVGIGYNIEATGREIRGLADFFDPAFAGRVAMLDDYRTTIGMVLLNLGYSPNTTNARQIAEAADFLIGRSNQIAAYAGDDAQDRLVDGTYDMVIEWSGDVFQVMEDNENIRYVIPQEGSIIWTDNVCIPAHAPNRPMAEAFINFLLKPAVGAQLSNYTAYGSPNLASLPLIDPDLLSDPAIYPPPSVQERLFFLVDVNLAATEVYLQAWDRVIASQDS
jgi:spermidine/putrescine transport system substrate-binding protein